MQRFLTLEGLSITDGTGKSTQDTGHYDITFAQIFDRQRLFDLLPLQCLGLEFEPSFTCPRPRFALGVLNEDVSLNKCRLPIVFDEHDCGDSCAIPPGLLSWFA